MDKYKQYLLKYIIPKHYTEKEWTNLSNTEKEQILNSYKSLNMDILATKENVKNKIERIN